MAINLSQLVEASISSDDDLMHIRTQAGIDKKILHSTLFGVPIITLESVAIGDIICRGLQGFRKIPLSTEYSPIGNNSVYAFKTLFLTSNLLVHIYTRTGLNTIFAIAGTIASDGSITYGSETTLTASGTAGYHYILDACRMTDTVFVAFANQLCIAGSVSGTTITIGGAVGPNSSGHNWVHRITDTTFCCVYLNASVYVAARVGSLSGLTISFPSGEVVKTAVASGGLFTAQYDNTSVLVTYDTASTSILIDRVSVSGTTPTWQAISVTAGSDSTTDFIRKLIKISDGHFVLFYSKTTSPARVVAVGIRLDGSSSSGAILTREETIIEQLGFSAWGTYQMEGIEAVHIGNGLIMLGYRDYRIRGANAGIKLFKYVDGKITPSFPAYVTIDDELGSNPNPGALGSTVFIDCELGRIFYAYKDFLDSNYLKGRLIDIPVIIGVSKHAGTSIKITFNGLIGGFTALTIGKRYYLDPLGRLTASPWCEEAYVGTAISATEMLIRH